MTYFPFMMNTKLKFVRICASVNGFCLSITAFSCKITIVNTVLKTASNDHQSFESRSTPGSTQVFYCTHKLWNGFRCYLTEVYQWPFGRGIITASPQNFDLANELKNRRSTTDEKSPQWLIRLVLPYFYMLTIDTHLNHYKHPEAVSSILENKCSNKPYSRKSWAGIFLWTKLDHFTL